MPDVVAKAMAVITGLLLLGVLAILVVTSRPPANAQEVVAEFRDAFPMLEGMQVRAYGAPAGSVGTIELGDEGLAEVTLLVDDTLPAPRADAVATIRQADTTGDSYIAYDPGTADEALADVDGIPTIACDPDTPTGPCANTLAAPRFDDLINAFGSSEQAGVKLILQNLSDALVERGDDVNRAALELVPALTSANRALAEVNSQNAALKSFITDMEDVSGQAAAKRAELAGLIDSFDATLSVTAAKTQPLDAGLEALPLTAKRLRQTLGQLTDAATASRPLAAQLAAGAPGLVSLLDKSPDFLDDVRYAVNLATPTLELTRRLLVAGAPTIKADPQRVVTGAFDLAPALSNLLKGILGGDETIKAFFGDEVNGGPEDRPGFGFGLGVAASDTANLPGYPSSWSNRRALRLGGIVNCESFGVPVGPGCLAGVLARREAQDAAPATPATPLTPARDAKPGKDPASQLPPGDLPAPQPLLPTPKPVQQVLSDTLQALSLPKQVLDQLAAQLGAGKPVPLNDLLDYFLK